MEVQSIISERGKQLLTVDNFKLSEIYRRNVLEVYIHIGHVS
jgi:hypothetical protein